MKMLVRVGTFLKYTVQYACITHCSFEYIGDFVMVSIWTPLPPVALHATNKVECNLLSFIDKFIHWTNEKLRFPLQCNGPSMEPTLFSKNILLTERISRFWRGYKSGDIVIAVSPLNADQYICKRIVAISGEKVLVSMPRPLDMEMEQGAHNVVEISSTPSDGQTTKSSRLVLDFVPRGCVWLEGDNKSNSSDSRYYGALPLGLIKSRVICRIWPLSQLQML